MNVTDVAHAPAGFHSFQDRNDLGFIELLRFIKVSFGPAMLPRKPLLFNGPVFREGYNLASKFLPRSAHDLFPSFTRTYLFCGGSDWADVTSRETNHQRILVPPNERLEHK